MPNNIKCECFVMQMLYVCVLCASCGSSRCCVLHDLQFLNARRGCKRGSAVLFILRSRLLVYSAGSRVNRVQVVLSGISVRMLCLSRQNLM